MEDFSNSVPVGDEEDQQPENGMRRQLGSENEGGELDGGAQPANNVEPCRLDPNACSRNEVHEENELILLTLTAEQNSQSCDAVEVCDLDQQQNGCSSVKYCTKKVAPPHKRQCLCRKLGKLESSRRSSVSRRRSSSEKTHSCACRMKCVSFETCNFCSVFHPQRVNEDASAPRAAPAVFSDFYHTENPNAPAPRLPAESQNWTVARVPQNYNDPNAYNYPMNGPVEPIARNEPAFCPYRQLSRPQIPTEASCGSMGYCSVCGGSDSTGSCDSMGVCQSCAEARNRFSRANFADEPSCDAIRRCSMCARNESVGSCAYRPPSRANLQPDYSCNSMGVCGAYPGSEARGFNGNLTPSSANFRPDPSCDSMGVCSVCAGPGAGGLNDNNNQPSRANFQTDPSCDSMSVCSVCAGSRAGGLNDNRPTSRGNFLSDPSCDSMGVCSVCAGNMAGGLNDDSNQPSRANFRPDPSCDSMGVCSVCNGNGAGGLNDNRPTSRGNFPPDPSCDSMGVCSVCAGNVVGGPNDNRPPSRGNFRPDPSCDSMGVCSVCAGNRAGGLNDDNNQPSRTNFQPDPSCDSMGVCSICNGNGTCGLNDDIDRPPSRGNYRPDPSCDSMGVCSACAANEAGPPSRANINDDPSCNSMACCSNCARNESDLNQSDRNGSQPPYRSNNGRPTSRGEFQPKPSCNSMRLCKDCAEDASNRPNSSRGSRPPTGRKTAFRDFEDATKPNYQNNQNDAGGFGPSKQSEPMDSIQEARLAELKNNGNIVIRTAYVTIQPYDLPELPQNSMTAATQKFAQTLNSAASLGIDTASQTDRRASKKQVKLFDGSTTTESESNHSMRTSADFFRPSKKDNSIGLAQALRPTRAKSSLLIQNDVISIDDLRRSSKSMTSMAKLLQKQPSKKPSVADKIRQQSKEYEALAAALEATSDRKTAARIQREMETCKSSIRSSIKAAMFEQRRNKTEKFDPIPIALFDNFEVV